MTQRITETVETNVRVTHSGRSGITLALLREFVREADELDLPGHLPIRWEDKLAGEGANRSGYVEASDRSIRQVPVALPAHAEVSR